MAASLVLVRDMPKSPEHMPVVEFADLEIGRANERYSASMAKYLPKPLRAFDCRGGARALNGFTGGNPAINEIERQRHENSDFRHRSPLCLQGQPNGQGSRILNSNRGRPMSASRGASSTTRAHGGGAD